MYRTTRRLCCGLLCGTSLLAAGGAASPPAPAPGDQGVEVQTLVAGRAFAGALAFSPDGRLLATGGDAGEVRLWSLPGARPGRNLRSPGAAQALAFSPDGRLLAAAGNDGRVRLWDAGSGALRRVLVTGTYYVTSVAFSPDGSLLAAATGDNTALSGDGNAVRLWDVATGRARATLRGHTDVVTAVAFRPGGGQLASGSRDRTVRLWDVANRRELRTLRGHGDGVNALAYSPGGEQLASAGADGSVRLWGADGQALRTLTGHTGPVGAVAWSPDGAALASAARTAGCCCGTPGPGSRAPLSLGTPRPSRAWPLARTARSLRPVGDATAPCACGTGRAPGGQTRRPVSWRRREALLAGGQRGPMSSPWLYPALTNFEQRHTD